MNSLARLLYRRLGVVAMGLALIASFSPLRALAQDVNIPDPALQGAILQALGLPGPTITQADMLDLTQLNCDSIGVTDTTGLQYAHNLTYLVLNNNPVTNFSGFSGLSNLTELDFIAGNLTNISFVTNLPRLKVTYLFNNSISNASPLA